MKVTVEMCLGCLNVCPQCRHLPLSCRREMAKAALMLLGFRDREEEPPGQDGGEPEDDDGKGRLPGLNLPQVAALDVLLPPPIKFGQVTHLGDVMEQPDDRR